MANFDFKLGEWFKQVDKEAKELKDKKDEHLRPQVEAKPIVEAPARVEPTRVETPVPVAETPTQVVTAVGMQEAVANTLTADTSTDVSTLEHESVNSSSNPVLFDAEDASDLPDFFSFLDRTKEREPEVMEPEVMEEDSLDYDIPTEQSPLDLRSEGTGQPRPLAPKPTPRVQPVVKQELPIERPQVQARAEVVQQAPVEVKPKPAPQPKQAARPAVEPQAVQEKWDRLPHHLQTLFGTAGEEVAQNSYKAFRENRGELIQRLLDPSVTLEEAARILNVCPTTVRRYTNRGVLKHFRTAGNQRRFRLSDVLVFMESSNRRVKSESKADRDETAVNDTPSF